MTASAATVVHHLHTCPRTHADGRDHQGGSVLPPGDLNVLVNGTPAARATDPLACIGSRDFIVVGSSTVIISGLMMARVGVRSMHGGVVTEGCSSVTIGGPSGGATLGNPGRAASLFPGQQNFGNCGLQSVQQLVHAATNRDIPEAEILAAALSQGWAEHDADPLQRGGTSPRNRQSVLSNYGVQSHLVPQSLDNIAQAVAEGRGVITSHDAGLLWADAHYVGSGHAVRTTGVQYDSDGRLTQVIINDTGTGHSQQAIPAGQFEQSFRPGRDANVTDETL